MHGTVKASLHDASADLPAWMRTAAGLEVLLAMSRGYRAMTYAEIAADFGLDPIVFGTWFVRIKAGLAARPHALANMQFLAELRKSGAYPPPVQPSDISMRECALARASALAARMPEWPNKPLPEPGFERRWHATGWQRDEDGVAMRTPAIRSRIKESCG